LERLWFKVIGVLEKATAWNWRFPNRNFQERFCR
jgi:hypothetical protein